MLYEEFANELAKFADEGRSFIGRGMTHEEREFRTWRNRVEGTYNEALRLGYIPSGKVKSSVRAYRALWIGAAADDHSAAFDREVLDTVDELEFIVDQCMRFGAPTSPKKDPGNEAGLTEIGLVPLVVPEKATISWLYRNLSLSTWLTIMGVAAAIFSAGVAVGSWGPISSFIARALAPSSN